MKRKKFPIWIIIILLLFLLIAGGIFAVRVANEKKFAILKQSIMYIIQESTGIK